MWIAFAFGSAFFAGITSILAKCGIKKNGFYRCDGSPDDYCFNLFVADGVYHRADGRYYID